MFIPLCDVDTLHDLLEVGEVVLPHDRLQPRPEHAQPDGVVAHAGHQLRVILGEGIPESSCVKISKQNNLSPCVKMGCNGNKWSCLLDHISAVKQTLPARPVNNPIFVRVDMKLGCCCLTKYGHKCEE